MKTWRDLTHHHKHKHSTQNYELFDTTHDVLEWVEHTEKRFQKKHHWFKKTRSFFHFVLLTSILFFSLLLISNWSSYIAFARAFFAPSELVDTQKAIEGSMEQSQVMNSAPSEDPADTIRQARLQKIIKRQLAQKQVTTQEIGLSYFDQDIAGISLSLEITPYEDRILIPRIGKNIPLINVEHKDASNSKEWNTVFMKELENGIIKYPGSADPGTAGNSFIFGHSSNYPWSKGNYNDVFALLNEVQLGDEIVVFFKQKKYVYVVREKSIVKPGHVSSLGDTPNKKQLTLMTCWPLGTTLNRLLIITELKDAPKNIQKA